MVLPVSPVSGPISMGMLNTQLGLSPTATISMNDVAVRTLLGVTTTNSLIMLEDAYGKSASNATPPPITSSNKTASQVTFTWTATDASIDTLKTWACIGKVWETSPEEWANVAGSRVVNFTSSDPGRVAQLNLWASANGVESATSSGCLVWTDMPNVSNIVLTNTGSGNSASWSAIAGSPTYNYQLWEYNTGWSVIQTGSAANTTVSFPSSILTSGRSYYLGVYATSNEGVNSPYWSNSNSLIY